MHPAPPLPSSSALPPSAITTAATVAAAAAATHARRVPTPGAPTRHVNHGLGIGPGRTTLNDVEGYAWVRRSYLGVRHLHYITLSGTVLKGRRVDSLSAAPASSSYVVHSVVTAFQKRRARRLMKLHQQLYAVEEELAEYRDRDGMTDEQQQYQQQLPLPPPPPPPPPPAAGDGDEWQVDVLGCQLEHSSRRHAITIQLMTRSPLSASSPPPTPSSPSPHDLNNNGVAHPVSHPPSSPLPSTPSLRLFLSLDSSAAVAHWAAALLRASHRDFHAHYILHEQIGEGAFASVHRALCLSTNMPVAVKHVKRRHFDIVTARELAREIYAMRYLNHPHVVGARDVFDTPNAVFIVMDLMRGGTMKDVVQAQGGRVSERRAMNVVRQVLVALSFLHRNGYVHRDVKLENVLVDESEGDGERAAGSGNEHVRLADFGYVNFVRVDEDDVDSNVHRRHNNRHRHRSKHNGKYDDDDYNHGYDDDDTDTDTDSDDLHMTSTHNPSHTNNSHTHNNNNNNDVHDCLRSLLGTPVYIAPEIIRRVPYGPAVDVYATGVMLYRMISGHYPFDGRDDDDRTLQLAVDARLVFVDPAWRRTTRLCRSFVRALLQPDPEKRLTAAAALLHPWLAQADQRNSNGATAGRERGRKEQSQQQGQQQQQQSHSQTQTPNQTTSQMQLPASPVTPGQVRREREVWEVTRGAGGGTSETGPPPLPRPAMQQGVVIQQQQQQQHTITKKKKNGIVADREQRYGDGDRRTKGALPNGNGHANDGALIMIDGDSSDVSATSTSDGGGKTHTVGGNGQQQQQNHEVVRGNGNAQANGDGVEYHAYSNKANGNHHQRQPQQQHSQHHEQRVRVQLAVSDEDNSRRGAPTVVPPAPGFPNGIGLGSGPAVVAVSGTGGACYRRDVNGNANIVAANSARRHQPTTDPQLLRQALESAKAKVRAAVWAIAFVTKVAILIGTRVPCRRVRSRSRVPVREQQQQEQELQVHQPPQQQEQMRQRAVTDAVPLQHGQQRKGGISTRSRAQSQAQVHYQNGQSPTSPRNRARSNHAHSHSRGHNGSATPRVEFDDDDDDGDAQAGDDGATVGRSDTGRRKSGRRLSIASVTRRLGRFSSLSRHHHHHAGEPRHGRWRGYGRNRQQSHADGVPQSSRSGAAGTGAGTSTSTGPGASASGSSRGIGAFGDRLRRTMTMSLGRR